MGEPTARSLFVSGSFTTATANGTNFPRQSIARINLDGSVNPWSVPARRHPEPDDRLADGSDARHVLYVGAGAGPNFAAAYHLDHGDMGDQVWKRSMTGNVESITLLPDGLNAVIGGHFGTAHKATKCGTHLLHGLAKINLATGALDCTWTPHLLPDNGNFTGCMGRPGRPHVPLGGRAVHLDLRGGRRDGLRSRAGHRSVHALGAGRAPQR